MRGADRPVLLVGAAGAVLAAAVVLGGGGAIGGRPPPVTARPSPPPAPAADLARAVAEDAPLPLTFLEPGEAVPSMAGPRLVQGPMEQVLYGGGAGPAAAEALQLFARKLDLTRDLRLGDRVRLLLRPAGEGFALDYAEWDGADGRVRLYRRAANGGFAVADFADEEGRSLDRLLLRTPLAVRRITSGFGPRLHPLLGYGRLHKGVDFAAEPGAPALAAADGVVEQARWAGEYGRMVRLGHGGGIETLYAHLSAWAVAPGARVRQGQVIGWTGASGLVTGPHLHFEVIQAGRPIDPAAARLATPRAPAERQDFNARKAQIEALLAALS